MADRRRGAGEGSIYRRRSDGRWVGTLDLGRVNGKRRRRVVYGRTQAEARERLRALQRQASHGQDLSTRPPTLEAWLREWLQIKKADGTRPSTLRGYTWLIDAHIVPALGNVRLDRLTPSNVRDLVTQKNGSGLKPATVAHILGLLRNALGEAERMDLVTRNVARAVRKPSVPKYEAAAIGVEDARRLLTVVRQHRLGALFSTALVMGLRRGEVLALAWDDVDFDHGVITVRRSLQRLDGRLTFQPTKTQKSRASMAVPAPLLDMLARHRRQQQVVRLAMGPDWPDTGLVFTSTTGTALEPRNVSRAWETLRVRAGLPNLRLHDLRHSCGTVLIGMGVHPRLVMEWLRHSQIAMSMETYAHVLPEMQRDVADALGRALF